MNHIPVLKDEVLEAFDYLSQVKEGIFVDGTLGNAGHSLALAKKFPELKFIGIDKDKNALDLAKKNIDEAGDVHRFYLVHDDFKNIDNILAGQEINKIDGALIDLGVSSMQLDEKERGFSFMDPEAELDMRMNQEEELDAKEIVNHYPEERIEKILTDYGEEKFGRKIAKNICYYRKLKRIEKVKDLLWILEKSIPRKVIVTGKKHFATQTFQALRIEVNNELGDLGKALESFVDFLKPGARLGVITFHSLEDRIVKNTFKELASSCSCPPNAPICTCNKKPTVKLVSNKPIIPAKEEIEANPRSRSAKLRIVEKI